MQSWQQLAACAIKPEKSERHVGAVQAPLSARGARNPEALLGGSGYGVPVVPGGIRMFEGWLHETLANSLGRILDISKEQLRISLWSGGCSAQRKRGGNGALWIAWAGGA